jgi:hypothetical protein
MPTGEESERTPEDAEREAPVDKFLRLAATPENFLRADGGESPGAFVMLNVGGITVADREEPATETAND